MTLRLPKILSDRIKALAKKQNRSKHGQIIQMLNTAIHIKESK